MNMPKPVPDVLRSTATSFNDEYRDRLQIFEDRHEVAPGVLVRLTGGHTPTRSVVDLVAGGKRLIRVGLFRELAQTRGLLVAAHLPFSSRRPRGDRRRRHSLSTGHTDRVGGAVATRGCPLGNTEVRKTRLPTNTASF